MQRREDGDGGTLLGLINGKGAVGVSRVAMRYRMEGDVKI